MKRLGVIFSVHIVCRIRPKWMYIPAVSLHGSPGHDSSCDYLRIAGLFNVGESSCWGKGQIVINIVRNHLTTRRAFK